MAYLVKPAHRVPAVTERLEPDPSLPRACVIGAGSSGIAAAKALYLTRVPFDCFEAGTVVGGNWVFDNPNGTSPEPGIDRLAGDRIVFTDGTEMRADVIVWCTGYKVSFPFFDPDVVAAPDNDLPLWKRVVHPDLPGAYFLGLLQPLGAVMPLAEAQSAWIAEVLTGRYVPPADDGVRRQMRTEHEAMKRRFYASARHTMEVDFDVYLQDLAKEREQGRERAAATAVGTPAMAPAE